MTRTATGTFSFIASIIVFVGALLLAPQAGSAQESPECEGEQQTIITATGIKITTCNWDLEDAPVDKAAAGLETTLAPPEPDLNACPCNFNKINPKRWKKFDQQRECLHFHQSQPFHNRIILIAQLRPPTQPAKTMQFLAQRAGITRNICSIALRSGVIFIDGITANARDDCWTDIFNYEQQHDIIGDGSENDCTIVDHH